MNPGDFRINRLHGERGKAFTCPECRYPIDVGWWDVYHGYKRVVSVMGYHIHQLLKGARGSNLNNILETIRNEVDVNVVDPEGFCEILPDIVRAEREKYQRSIIL